MMSIDTNKSLPKVAVVILSWNGKDFLEQFLPSVCATTYPNAEIYVADNASTDDSIPFLKEHYPQVKIIALEKNLGFASGYNEALKQVDAPYYVLLNQDVEVTPKWIEPIIEMMEAEPDIGACQPKIRAFHDKESFEYAGAAGGFMDSHGYMFCRGRMFQQVEKDEGQYEDILPVFWASGCAMFIRSELYHKLGGLDDEFFAHMEEIDLCWRVKNAGYRIMCHTASIVYHVGGGSLPQGNPRKTYLNFRNNLAMLVKNLPDELLNRTMFRRLLMDVMAAYKTLLTGHPKDFFAIAKAHWHFLRRYSHWLKRRQEVKKNLDKHYPNRKEPDTFGWYDASIIWGHFFKGYQKFSDLPRRYLR